VGAAGGPKITTSVYQTLLNRLEFGLSLPDAVAAPRIHQQWRPRELMVERGLSRDIRDGLERYGYTLSDKISMAKVHALERFSDGRAWGVPDPRGEGAAVAE
jgi:gamma-glutamyltranspeptidase/glutathione hydrolase